MLRRPSPSFAPTGAGAPVLARRGSARTLLAGTRRRAAGPDVPLDGGAAEHPSPSGVVPRMRRPRSTSAPESTDTTGSTGSAGSTASTELADRVPRGRGTALEERIERHLTRLQGGARPRTAGTVDDDRARRDPDTTSFAVVRPDAVDAAPHAVLPARVATVADRPRTAELPALSALD